MGVLRYFPGSEPDRAARPDASAAAEHEPAEHEPAEHEPAEQRRRRPEGPPVASEPGWVVPGLGTPGTVALGTAEPGTADPSSAAGASARPERRRAETSGKAERISLGALSRHDVSEAEMLDKLVSRGFDADEAADEVERLKRVGLLDDVALAERLVASLRERKGLGDSAIGPALRLRRIPTPVIEAALADPDQEASLDRLEALARERARRLGSLEPAVAERRLMAYLMRKGYSGRAARDAVRRALTAGPLP